VARGALELLIAPGGAHVLKKDIDAVLKTHCQLILVDGFSGMAIGIIINIIEHIDPFLYLPAEFS